MVNKPLGDDSDINAEREDDLQEAKEGIDGLSHACGEVLEESGRVHSVVAVDGMERVQIHCV